MAMNDLNIINDLKGFRRGELWQQKPTLCGIGCGVE